MINRFFSVFFICVFTALNCYSEKLTSNSREELHLTVYNQNLAFIKDVRKVKLSQGRSTLIFTDIPPSIKPESVSLSSLNHPDDFSLISQDYRNDLINRNSLLNKFVGKKIKLVSYDENNAPERTIEATLLSTDGPIYEIDGEIHLGFPGYQVLPYKPEDLVVEPSLFWEIETASSREHRLEAAYLAENFSWSADYILKVSDSEKKADIKAFATIDNRTGVKYENASLTLLAGDVSRVRVPRIMKAFGGGRLAEAVPASGIQQEEFSDYYIYKVKEPVTINNNQRKQIKLLEKSGINITKEYTVLSERNIYTSRYPNEQEQSVGIYLNFENSEREGAGMPLPGGIVRVYTENAKGELRFSGEDHIGHIPEGEKVRVRTGNAFDLKYERKQTDFKRLYQNTYETAWEITLKNRKKEPVEVSVVETLSGDWEIMSRSLPYEKINAFKIKFDVKIPAQSKETVNYRVKVKY